MDFYQSYVNQRVRTLSPNEIVRMGPNNGMLIDVNEASRVSRLLHGSNVNVFDNEERNNLLNKITKVTSSYVSREVENIIQHYITK
ncbi:MAG: hypothetical protein K0R18_1388 [Bacillales bacterium]|nr:hypothetical protein [Bacillales bacterium]